MYRDISAHLYKLYLCLVKLLTLVFSFYFLALPCMPCMDKSECKEQAGTTSITAGSHAGHQDEDESCAPFCNCTCCGQIVSESSSALKMATVKQPPDKKQPAFYCSISLPSDYFGNIWQPPRID